MDEWEALAERVKNAELSFIIEPYIRFKGEAGEQATMFFLDPSGNALDSRLLPIKAKYLHLIGLNSVSLQARVNLVRISTQTSLLCAHIVVGILTETQFGSSFLIFSYRY